MGPSKANTVQVRPPWNYKAGLTLRNRNQSGVTESFSTTTTAARIDP